MTQYYFETLSLHPRPKRLESFTSYLARIANENGIKSISDLSEVLEAKINTRIFDTPPLSFGKIALYTYCEDSQIFATTFFHLVKKFHKSMHPRQIADFLQNSLSQHLRYCPKCLAEVPYYRLTWRFSVLPGCNVHGCRFLNQCGLCKKPLPLFSPSCEIGRCPLCGGDLLSCSVEVLSENEMRNANRVTDIEYLLSPSSSEEDENFTKKVGYRFATLRRERKLSTQQIADYLSISIQEVRNIEQGGIHQFTSLSGYLRYANYLGISLQCICEDCDNMKVKFEVYCPEVAILASLTEQLVLQPYEDVMVEHVQEVILALQNLEKPITRTDIIKFMGLTPKRLKQHRIVNALWEKLSSDARNKIAKQRQHTESRYVEEVRRILNMSSDYGETLTIDTVGAIIGVSGTNLRQYSRVVELFNQNSSWEKRHRKRESLFLEQIRVGIQKDVPQANVIFDQVHMAIQDTIASGGKVYLSSISKIVGVPVYQLRSYPQVNALLNHFSPRRKRR